MLHLFSLIFCILINVLLEYLLPLFAVFWICYGWVCFYWYTPYRVPSTQANSYFCVKYFWRYTPLCICKHIAKRVDFDNIDKRASYKTSLCPFCTIPGFSQIIRSNELIQYKKQTLAHGFPEKHKKCHCSRIKHNQRSRQNDWGHQRGHRP